MGLSGSRRGWYRLLPHLATHVQAIAFDNRGTGSSDPVTRPLSMGDLVDDALAVLDSAGHETAHVMGVSMGGMIAQHLALDHRDRVRSLILGCTTAGGRRGAPPWRMMTATALRPVVGATRTFPIVIPALYAQRTRDEQPERVEADLRIRLPGNTHNRKPRGRTSRPDRPDTGTRRAQRAATARHDTRSRLAELEGLEVTVIHGEEDVLVPAEAGRALG